MSTCFVIMPFGQTSAMHTEDYWNAHFTRILKPAIEMASDGPKRLGYQAKRSDSAGGAIDDDVFDHLLQKADIVLADLTDTSPNVMYELGIRHCLRDRTIMIIEKDQEAKIPFYLKNYRTIPYSVAQGRDIHDFNQLIQQRLLDIQQSATTTSDNPIFSYLQKKGQHIEILPQQEWIRQSEKIRESGFNTIYIPSENDKRNARKEVIIRNARQYIHLLASSGHAYLYRYANRFRTALQDRLQANVPTKIILDNPWSKNRVLLTLSELSANNAGLQPIEKTALEKYAQSDFTGFDPVELIEQSEHYRNKYRPSLSGYQELAQQFASTIQLRICTYPVAVTTLLTESIGFFEPYIRSHQQSRIHQAMNTFELEFSSSHYLYHGCTAYFDTLWKLSIPYDRFLATTDFWKQQLRGEYDQHIDSNGSSA
jgi:hypothetical protein